MVALVELTGTSQHADGTVDADQLKFVYTAPLFDTGGDLLIDTTPIWVTPDPDNGEWSVDLYPNNDPDLTPSGSAVDVYQHHKRITTVIIPYDQGASIALSTLPEATTTVYQNYITQANLDAELEPITDSIDSLETSLANETSGRTAADVLINTNITNLTNRVAHTGTPGIAAGAGAGTGPTLSIVGTDTAGYIELTPGTTPTNNSTVFTVTFAQSFAAVPSVVHSPGSVGALGRNSVGGVYVDPANITTAGWSMSVSSSALVAGTVYKWNFQVSC